MTIILRHSESLRGHSALEGEGISTLGRLAHPFPLQKPAKEFEAFVFDKILSALLQKKKQQYRQNQDVHITHFPRVDTLGYKNDTPPEFVRLKSVFFILISDGFYLSFS
ncbi:hypothetical protein [Cyclobacterium sediminis]